MANSLEVRNPYFDPCLARFVWSLPDNISIKKTMTNLYFVIFYQKNFLAKSMQEKTRFRATLGFMA